ncbi:Multidrug resistance-associated ABC transporter protein [Mycena indigotica]|uniref:Multidrug resistance-associated ABC transporter protein n=1 Tax=Mycena indigotica TaxID=2126181 RepID=A0A8H6SD47_9AGAR|nr:Multidrug resistance-associated ABC transporter protein [Mycena indigotica]KAF7297335.1 Multidrug resistance-associated ABC transporter protein [Mycena indigotica]
MHFFKFFHPPPAPPAFGKGKTVPERSSSFLNQLVVHWIGPFLDVGFSRPLEKDDLWELPTDRLTGATADVLEARFYSRCPPEQRPSAFRDTPEESRHSHESEAASTTVEDKEKQTPSTENEKTSAPTKPRRFWQRKPRKLHDSSLFRAVHHTFLVRIWAGGMLKLIADTLRTTSPLVNKALLTWLAESYVYHRATDEQKALFPKPPRGIGYGIGLGIVLFAMQEIASLMTNHSQQTMMAVGLSVRTGIIGAVFRKSLRLSGRARLEHSVGQTTTIISTDASRLDRFCQFGHNVWVSPIQIIVGVGLLLGNLGYSALVGLGVLLLGFPLQVILVRIMFKQRTKGVKITDTRVRLTNEVLQGIRLIKYYAWEGFYTQQIGSLREREIATVRKMAIARAAMIGIITVIPVLASVLSFITYALSGHNLDIAIIFSSLQFFNIIRMPLAFIPFVLSALSDALVAFRRIGAFLTAEELPEPYLIADTQTNAVDVDASFTWETVEKLDGSKFGAKKGKGPGGGKGKKSGKDIKKSRSVLPTTSSDPASGAVTPAEEEKPFELKNLKMTVPRGAFIAIVGRVGSGKSSILQALIGEMRKTEGTVRFGGSIAYVPQTAWIRNATLRQNIVFGQKDDEDKFREVVAACSLEHDLEVLPHGEDTEIGERGINLSGGQKARVSLARASYSPAEIILLDDPLSAVDSYVGKAILDRCILHGPLANRTRVLVTHALHVLDKADYIYASVMDNGTIKEQGTYQTLLKDGIVFSKLMEEYGSLEAEKEKEAAKGKKATTESEQDDPKKEQAALMQTEERNTGAVSWATYGQYLKYGGGLTWAPLILGLLTLSQGAQVLNTLWLGFWTGGTISGFTQGQYIAVYAGMGAAMGVFSFLLSFAFALVSLMASLRLFKAALAHVLRSPTSFFDTTPMGRILSRLVKDQDTLDNELSMNTFQLLTTFSSVLGTVALVFYTFPYLGIIFAPMIVLYYMISSYYRRSSVETKRLDSLMRSALYASYTETLTGLSTIRAYRDQSDSIKHAEQGLDMENRAYYMTITLQMWLGLRLDVFGNVLILGIALFAAGLQVASFVFNIGVVLSYSLSITQVFSQMVALFATNEQNMNSVERLVTYAELPAEGAATTPNDPPATWPDQGEIMFKNVKMAYREGLPLVLKGISFDIKPGEKVGIVGRTGAGKSSLLQVLFRMVEVQSGQVDIDGRNIRDVGLDTLRGRLALVPQDSVLFLGTLRENLDPQNSKTDTELISVLQRAWLLPRPGEAPDPIAEAKFSLDSKIGDEGSNYSAGEKQLLALCRALVKNSPIIILDEATSSVDVETDAKLQRTIRTEFASSTLLCIAHRLNTIAYYDRILVMDQGQVVEFDTVLNLFDREESIFRSLCDEANLSRADILRIRAEEVSP